MMRFRDEGNWLDRGEVRHRVFLLGCDLIHVLLVLENILYGMYRLVELGLKS